MRIREGYIKFESFEGWVVTAIGEESKRNKIMVTLNGTAAEIWDMLADGKSDEEAAAALSEEYGISREKARDDVHRIVDTLRSEGILQE